MYAWPDVDLLPRRTVLLHWLRRPLQVLHQKRYSPLCYLGKVKGSIIYFAGLILIVINLGFFGAIAQIFGIVLIFRTFLPDLYDYTCKIPLVGKYLSTFDGT
jgi:hypothetical protein